MTRLLEDGRTLGVNPHRQNAAYTKVHADVLALVADPEARAQLERLAEHHPDADVRTAFHEELNPLVPDSSQELPDWLAHPAVGLGQLAGVLETRQCLVLPETASWDEAWGLSWLAGRPSTGGGPWPRDGQGRALALVLQVAIDADRWTDATIEWAQAQGLPTRGVLQVFHDLWSDEPDALCVRHVPEPGPDVEDYPPDYDLIVHPARRTGETLALSARSPLDVDGLDEETFEAWDEARERFDASHTWMHRQEFGTPARPVTTLLGYGWNSERVSLENLGLSGSGEDWVLLVDIPGVRHLAGWFGDEGHLEVWIRRADLRAGRFDGVRPLMRMG